MTVLIVLGVILCLIFLLLMTCVKVNVISREDITIRVGAGPFLIKVFPKKEKKIRLKDFSKEKYLKLLEEEKKAPDTPEEKKEKKKEKGSIPRTISLVRRILERLDVYTGRIYTKVSHLDVAVGGDDAASAAIAYGAVSQSVSYLIELLDQKTRLRIPNPEKLSVRVDYLADGTKFSLDLTIKIRIIDALRTAVEILMIKMKHDGEYCESGSNNTNKRKVGK